jgi:hypothetical protein
MTSEECLRKAYDIRQRARSTDDPLLAADFRLLAGEWRRLADHPDGSALERTVRLTPLSIHSG